MRTRLVALVLTLAVLGFDPAPAIAVDPAGPFCLTRAPFGDVLELFVLPSGGPNVLLSGRLGPEATGIPLAGSGYVSGGSFRFSVSGQTAATPGRLFVADGVLSLATGGGTGMCYQIGITGLCGDGTPVTYAAAACATP
jgi:hypothetical protein